MTIQEYKDDLTYATTKLGSENPGSFLGYFLRSCLAADWENYELLRPILQQMKRKYPLWKGAAGDNPNPFAD